MTDRVRDTPRSPGRLLDYLIVMTRLKLPALYRLLDLGNNLYGHLFFRGFKGTFSRRHWEGNRPGSQIRVLTEAEIPELMAILDAASPRSRELFKPHPLTAETFRELMAAPYYLAIGCFLDDKLVGYAFLRLYFPKKAFAGYFVADDHQGNGYGKHLFNILKGIVGETSFGLYTCNKEENLPSINVSKDFLIEQKLPGGYLVLKHAVPRRSAPAQRVAEPLRQQPR